MSADLFVIEGADDTPPAAVYRYGNQLCLLGTGQGPAQRAALRSVVASYGLVEELVLLSSSIRPCPDANDDLLDELPARRRRHLRPAGAEPAPGSPPGVPVEDYAVLGGLGSVRIGPQTWPGWTFADSDLRVLRIGPPTWGRVGFYVAGCRALVLPALAPDAADDDEQRLLVDDAARLLVLLDDGTVEAVSAGLTAPWDVTPCRTLLHSVIEAGRYLPGHE